MATLGFVVAKDTTLGSTLTEVLDLVAQYIIGRV